MTAFDPAPAAAALIARRDARQPAGPLDPAITPRTEADAALVQRAVASQRGVRIGGFKIGATGARMQGYLGIDHPCGGFMASGDIHASGVALPYANFRNVAVECELAVRLGADMPVAPTTPEQARAAVAELFAAIEIVENRYGAPPIGDVKGIGTPVLVADQFYHTACVLGAPAADWQGIDLLAIQGRSLMNGTQRDAGHGRDLLGDPLRGLAWLAGSDLAAAFGGLRAGQVVMLGSVTPPVGVECPCEVQMDFDGLPAVRLTFS
jgi:2-keto-4-pentenoate hydratase